MDNEAPGVVDDGGGGAIARQARGGDKFTDDATWISIQPFGSHANEQRRRRSSDI